MDKTIRPNGAYNGQCPVCSGQLVASYDKVLTCQPHPNHFQINENRFEWAWIRFDGGRFTGLDLLKSLLESNNAPEKPTLDEVLKAHEPEKAK